MRRYFAPHRHSALLIAIIAAFAVRPVISEAGVGNAVFGIATMIIAIPTGVKIFNWLFTMYRGKIHFASPMLWFMGFVFLFIMGGVAGVLMAVPPIDFQLKAQRINDCVNDFHFAFHTLTQCRKFFITHSFFLPTFQGDWE